MGFSSARYDRQEGPERKWKVHPIWRGIGCILLIMIPIISCALAYDLMRGDRPFAMPKELVEPLLIPPVNFAPVEVVTNPINSFLISGRYYIGDIFFAIVFIFIGFGILAIFYSLLFRLFGPPRYGPYDVPQIKSGKRRR